jgi:hypothetical protein
MQEQSIIFKHSEGDEKNINNIIIKQICEVK